MNYPLDRLAFWVREKNQSSAEVNFVFPFENMLIPIEVKSGKSGKLRSLQIFMDDCQHDIAIRLYSGELSLHTAVTPSGKSFRLLNLPYLLGEQLSAYIAWMKLNDKS
jgi:hypothetical protein